MRPALVPCVLVLACGGGGGPIGGAAIPSPTSAVRLGNAFHPSSFAYDSAGDMYVTFIGANGCTIGTQPCGTANFAKWDGAGALLWSQTLGPSPLVAVGASGTFIVDSDHFAELDASGNAQWTNPNTDTVAAIAPTPSGGLALAGTSVVLADATGKLTTGATLPGLGRAVAVDASGNVYVAGGSPSLFVTKYDTTLTPVWAMTYAVSSTGGAVAITLDSTGEPTVALVSPTALGSDAGASTPSNHFVILALDASGAMRWSSDWTGITNDAAPFGPVMTGAGNLVVLANASGALTLGGTVVGADAGYQAVLGALDPTSGAAKWAHGFEGAGPFTLDPTGHLAILVNPIHCPADFGGGSIACSSDDLWAVVYPL